MVAAVALELVLCLISVTYSGHRGTLQPNGHCSKSPMLPLVTLNLDNFIILLNDYSLSRATERLCGGRSSFHLNWPWNMSVGLSRANANCVCIVNPGSSHSLGMSVRACVHTLTHPKVDWQSKGKAPARLTEMWEHWINKGSLFISLISRLCNLFFPRA